jgi:hypothetical protein
MAHYAFINENNIVTEVITGNDENNTDELPVGFNSWEQWYGNFRGQTCIRTSYNTIGNQHRLGGTAFRGNYASVGYFYDEVNDVFIPPQPSLDNWTFILNTDTWSWDGVENE